MKRLCICAHPGTLCIRAQTENRMRLFFLLGFNALLLTSAVAAPLKPAWELTFDSFNAVPGYALTNDVSFMGERVELLMNARGLGADSQNRAWYWSLDPASESPTLRSTPGMFGAAPSYRTATSSGELIISAASGPEFQGYCGAVSLDHQLQPRWSRSWTMNTPGGCSGTKAMSDGGALLVTQSSMERIGADGITRWTRSAPFGPRYILKQDKVLLLAAGLPTQLELLNSDTGVVEQAHALNFPIHQVLASRYADEGLELLVSSPDLTTGLLAYYLLQTFDGMLPPRWDRITQGDFRSAKPHDHGFALLSIDQIHVYDGTQLRWSRPLQSRDGPYGVEINGAGAVAFVGQSGILRYDAQGQLLGSPWAPPGPFNVRIALSPNGTLWVIHSARGYLWPRPADELYRLRPHSDIPDLHMPLWLPSSGSAAGHLHIDVDGSTQAMMSRAATSLTSMTGAWEHLEFDPHGTLRNRIQTPGPAPFAVQRLGDQWALLSSTFSGNLLSVWDPESNSVEQRPVGQGAQLQCHGPHCGLVDWSEDQTHPRLTLFDANGNVQFLQADITPIRCQGQLRGLRRNPDGTRDLLDFATQPPQIVMSLEYLPYDTRFACDGDRLLQLTNDQVLSLRGPAGPAWPASVSPISGMTLDHQRLFALAPGLDDPDSLHVLQLSLADGSVQRRFRSPIHPYASLLDRHLASQDGRLYWMVSQQGGVLHAVHADGRTIQTDANLAGMVRTLDADRAVMIAHGRIAAYSVSLFRDGLETVD